MSSIVLTGYSGLLGGAVLRQLAGAHEVICLGRTPPSAPNPGTARITFAEADLAGTDLAAALPKHADAIVHLAQGDGHNRFPEAAEHVFAVNVGATSQLLNWGQKAGITCFVHASTGGLYGTGPQPFREADPVRIEGPLAHYLATKRSAELLASAYEKYFNVVALRYFFIYGAGQKANMLMPRLVASVRSGTAINLAGQDGIEINPIHADDAAAATIKALDLDRSATINVAGPQPLSLRAIGMAIGNAVQREAQFKSTPAATVGHVVADTAMMREFLVPPEIAFADGVATLCG
ncbi:MAG: NAD(P)-dependent oxidoreductase [Hyphomicrobiaceae bacterium]